MSQSGGIEGIDRISSPGSLKRKRPTTDTARSRPSPGAAVNSTSSRHMATTNGASASQYTSPDSDSLGSTASSVFTSNSHAFAQNRKASTNGLTPLTNHTEPSPPKGNSPHHSKHTADMASTSHVPASDIASSSQERTQRPQMLPPSGQVKGYRAVWDPELDNKLSREERKRAMFRKRDFGAEVRYTFHILLSLRNMIHIT